MNEKEVVQLKIKLKNTPVWRRVIVEKDITFHKLNKIIQKAMGWGGYHLYSFVVDGLEICIPHEDMATIRDLADARDTYIKDWLNEGADFEYIYDYGDNWEHKIKVEKFLEPEKEKYPICIDGKKACPPEDCGGIIGYKKILEYLENPEENELEESYSIIAEDYEPNNFDIEKVNKELENLEDDELDELLNMDSGTEKENSQEEPPTANAKQMALQQFVPLNELLLEDTEEVKKIKSLFKKEGEYSFLLASIESAIMIYDQYYEGLKDKDVVRMLKNIKENYQKDIRSFDEELEQMIMFYLSKMLQIRETTHYELKLAIDYVLWSIDNRKHLGDRGYINWLKDFFSGNSSFPQMPEEDVRDAQKDAEEFSQE